MAPNHRVLNALHAMMNLGISVDRIKPVLKNLLNLHRKNWDLIEAENYRVLVDTMYENDEAEALAKKNDAINEREHEEKEEVEEQDELERPLKKSRLRNQNTRSSLQDHHSSSPNLAESSFKLLKDEPVKLPEVPEPSTTELPIGHMMQKETRNEGCTESYSQLEVATSPLNEVKLLLSSTSPDFHMPDIDTVVKLVEDRCRQSYKITDPNFSVMKIMKDICECFLLLGSEKSEDRTQTDQSETVISCDTQLEALPIGLESPHDDDVVDICKGNERVVISLVNDVNNEAPPSFHYIPKNVVFQNAYLNFSLARMGDDNSCSNCIGDCLSLPIPCACAYETGGEFAYNNEGLVKEEFLEECVSMNRDPEKHCHFFCKECPLERSKKEEIIEPCKGHLMRKFIKECWWKCGCNKRCGNRVVQQGITRNIQVFMTKGKGWALRTLEDLPKGAFVCEYVGEVLTNAELFDRVSKCPEGEKHSYPVLLDADWGSEGVLNDEEALCLDATYYGNVARFINHRCFDSTLVEIPVEIETPDHHYYHLAFFTSRKVKAMEELTWDYGINFSDRKHPVKAFRCQCGSRFCRNTRRKRSRFGKR